LNLVNLHIWNAPGQTIPQNAFVVYAHSNVDIQPMNQTNQIFGLEHILMVTKI